jgi:hypothetical protein
MFSRLLNPLAGNAGVRRSGAQAEYTIQMQKTRGKPWLAPRFQ